MVNIGLPNHNWLASIQIRQIKRSKSMLQCNYIRHQINSSFQNYGFRELRRRRNQSGGSNSAPDHYHCRWSPPQFDHRRHHHFPRTRLSSETPAEILTNPSKANPTLILISLYLPQDQPLPLPLPLPTW